MIDLKGLILIILLVNKVNSYVTENNINLDIENEAKEVGNSSEYVDINRNPAEVFDGVYSECVLFFSYLCIQNKTLQYLRELNSQDEVTVLGDYVKFVKIYPSANVNMNVTSDTNEARSQDLTDMINDAVNEFFDHHRLRLHTLGKDVDVARTVDEFVGRKRRKGGGGGGGSKDDGGKKKMMMMAMMCMKMKMMVMLPAMMGMMGMMSFKGMMFSMMSFMIAKMMLLMKILEKKGGGGSGGDGGWAASGGGAGGAWMPAVGSGGASDGYGGPGGGYNAAGEWQSRSIPEFLTHEVAPPEYKHSGPIISFVTPLIRYSNYNKANSNENRSNQNYPDTHDEQPSDINEKTVLKYINNERIKFENDSSNYTLSQNVESSKKSKDNIHSRSKRGIMDLISSYVSTIWTNHFLKNNFKYQNPLTQFPKYRIINGIKYVYYPQRLLNRLKYPKIMPIDNVKQNDDLKPIVAVEDYNKGEIEDFNKGEIVDQEVEGRMNRKRFKKMKKKVEEMNDVIEDNPWE